MLGFQSKQFPSETECFAFNQKYDVKWRGGGWGFAGLVSPMLPLEAHENYHLAPNLCFLNLSGKFLFLGWKFLMDIYHVLSSLTYFRFFFCRLCINIKVVMSEE